MRLIDADGLNALIGDERAILHNEQRTFKAMSENEFSTRDYMLSHFQYLIDNAPTVELHMGRMTNGIVIPIERPQGEWARHDEWVGGVYVGGFYHVNCTCEDGYYSKWETNFCPHCGAKMKGAEE